MVFIPQGSFTMGPSDQDVPFANVSESKTVSVGAFYMDETEITNNEYRQFTTWVRDSIVRRLATKTPTRTAQIKSQKTVIRRTPYITTAVFADRR